MIFWLGVIASALTSLSYLPQVMKAWPRNSTEDLSWKMLTALSLGLLLWIVYGFMKGDGIIVAANGLGAALSLTVLGCKLRDIWRA
jgi:MtN3 and saliva related transmembrane protein